MDIDEVRNKTQHRRRVIRLDGENNEAHWWRPLEDQSRKEVHPPLQNCAHPCTSVATPSRCGSATWSPTPSLQSTPSGWTHRRLPPSSSSSKRLIVVFRLVQPAVVVAILWIRHDRTRGCPAPSSQSTTPGRTRRRLPTPTTCSLPCSPATELGSLFPLLHLSRAIIKLLFRKKEGEHLKCHHRGKLTSGTRTTTRIVAILLESSGRPVGAIYIVVGRREVNFPALRQPCTG